MGAFGDCKKGGHFDLLFDLVYSGVETSVSKIIKKFQLDFDQTTYLDVSYQYLGQVRRWAILTYFLT